MKHYGTFARSFWDKDVTKDGEDTVALAGMCRIISPRDPCISSNTVKPLFRSFGAGSVYCFRVYPVHVQHRNADAAPHRGGSDVVKGL